MQKITGTCQINVKQNVCHNELSLVLTNQNAESKERSYLLLCIAFLLLGPGVAEEHNIHLINITVTVCERFDNRNMIHIQDFKFSFYVKY